MSETKTRLRRSVEVIGAAVTVESGGTEETFLILHERSPGPDRPPRCWWSSPLYGLSSAPDPDQIPPSWVEQVPAATLKLLHLALRLGAAGGRQ